MDFHYLHLGAPQRRQISIQEVGTKSIAQNNNSTQEEGTKLNAQRKEELPSLVTIKITKKISQYKILKDRFCNESSTL